ncbi:MAG: YidC/Oxa1 family membrane protein insertase [Ruminococcaceae bacterium]|nr:YidC/Oxa1 family membrane protein insertase [Oscillospiraceae bacterium]
MIDFLAKLLGYVMYGCSWLVGNNYVIALLLFALAMQILLCPFGIKQQKNMVKQAYLRPKEMAIRRKYAGRNDRATMQKLQNEIMQLQQEAGYSPLAGCLPMLFQLILIFPIYQVAIRPLEFIVGLSKESYEKILGEINVILSSNGASEIGAKSGSAQVQVASWLNNEANRGLLSDEMQAAVNELDFIPDVSLFGQDLGVTPFDSFGTGYWWLIFIPILNLGLMYLSQFLSKKLQYQSTIQEQANNQMNSMKIMMLVMPLMTMFITFSFASAIGIYWIFRTLLSMLQQFILYKAMPYPKFTEEDYRNAEKEMKGKKVSQAPANYVAGDKPIRSLHHIDDDE